MKVSDMFPSKYLRAADIPAGREVQVIISRLEQVAIEGEAELKPVLFFEKARKGLVLNKTNALAIAEKYGDDAEFWNGKPVIVFASTVLFQGKNTPCLRVRVPALPATAPAAPTLPATLPVDVFAAVNSQLAQEAPDEFSFP